MFSFVLLLLVTLTVYHYTKETEGFKSTAEVKKPIDQVVQRLSSLSSSSSSASSPSASSASPSPSASLLPGLLPTAPFEQTAAMSPLPYQDTTAVKANRQQLLTALEMLKGFLAYEAPHLEERSDPAIQLPLQTARSDFYTLQNEVSVLNRNPGIQPTILLGNLNDISANLAFLQQKVRLLGSAGALQGPIYSFHDEGKGQGQGQGQTEGFQNEASLGQVATQKELEDFLAKVEGERARLGASATTDPVLQARIRALTEMRQTVRGIVEQLRTKKMLPTEVPILKADIDKAFPILGKPSEPLPQLIRSLQLPAGWGNALPSSLQKDPETTRQIAQLVDKYADTIIHGLSARFEVSYTPPTESERVRRTRSTVDKIGFPSAYDLDRVATQGAFQPRPSGGDRPVTDRLAGLPQEAGRGPSSSSSIPARFDWKERARQIEDQIRKRGLRTEDFGVMPKSQKVSTDFSWKGYAKMMCTRLQATMDPALPETCGCPPMDWKGWRP